MSPLAKDFLGKANSQTGKPYRFGAETHLDDPDPQAFDCSELVQWALAQVGVKFPDGSGNQYAACQALPLAHARLTPGALVFVSRDGRPSGIHHVGISRGDGYTVEARGKRWGVGVWPWRSAWNLAGLVPALSYERIEPAPSPGAAHSSPAASHFVVKLGDRVVPGVEARLIEGRAWVPLRPLAEFLGFEVYAPDLPLNKTIFLFEKGEDLP